MRIRRRVWSGVAGTVATAVGLTLVLVPSASAGVTLDGTTPVVATTPDTYPFTTTSASWSLVAVRPEPGHDYNLRLYATGRKAPLASSSLGANRTDFVVINSGPGHRALGRYVAAVIRPAGGSGGYSVRWAQQNLTLPVPTNPLPTTTNALGLPDNASAQVLAISLQANQGLRVKFAAGTAVFLAGPTPDVVGRAGVSNTYVVGSTTGGTGGARCRAFLVPTAGTYALVIVNDTAGSWPGASGSGVGFLPFRYNPKVDSPTACPETQYGDK